MQKKVCKDCKKPVSQDAERCRECFHKSTIGREAWNKGKRTAFVVCRDCGKKSYHKGKVWDRCRDCMAKYFSRTFKGRKSTYIPYGNKYRLGKKFSEEAKRKMSATRQGIPLSEWDGYIKTENQRIRYTTEYAFWRTAVFMRDDFTCKNCGVRGGKLEADHIKPFSKYPELRYTIDNGRTLCRDCHRKTDTWGFKTVWQKQ